MILKTYFPLAVAGFVAAVGLFFLPAVVAEHPLVTPDPTHRTVLLALCVTLIAAGVLFIFLFFAGRLKRSGKSVRQVRVEAVAKLSDEPMLADIALKDPDPKVRDAAQRRLKEIAG
jgi:hypothetical protein